MRFDIDFQAARRRLVTLAFSAPYKRSYLLISFSTDVTSVAFSVACTRTC